MAIRIGNDTPTKFYFEDAACSRLYFGDDLVWTAGIALSHTPTSGTFDASFFGQNFGIGVTLMPDPFPIRTNNAPGAIGGQAFMAGILCKTPCLTNEMYVEGTISAVSANDRGNTWFIGADSTTALTKAMIFYLAPNGDMGIGRWTGGGNGGWTWATNPGGGTSATNDVIKFQVRKSGSNWIYQAFKNGGSTPILSYTDTNGTFFGTPGKVGGWGGLTRQNNFANFRNDGIKGPFKIGDL
jgi:hypothetical protein